MQLFYNPNISEKDSTFTFDKEESKHIIKVLRKNERDVVFITNGKGFLFEAEIQLASEKKCEVKIVKCTFKESLPYKLHIAIAPTKMNDRIEWFLEKATEIGIHEITPIICSNSEQKFFKKERAEKIISTAMKQSLHFYLPKLNEAITFNEFISQNNSDNLYIAHCEQTDKKSLKNLVKPNENYTILIGPEGDFSHQEINKAIAKKFQPVLLGDTRLRTETAGLFACITVALANN